MERNLRAAYDLAAADDPFDDPGELARAAMVEGAGLRKRRHRVVGAAVAAGVLAVAGTVAGLVAPRAQEPPVTVAAAMMPVPAETCSQRPVERDATDVAIFLSPRVTDRQRVAVHEALTSDPRVGVLGYEDKGTAYQRFKKLWADSPDFVASVSMQQLPESFRLRLTQPAQYVALRKEYAAMGGVDQIVGRVCPASAPIGGVL